MECVVLSQQGIKKINQGTFELFYQDIETSIRKFTPGEWCYFADSRKERYFLGFLNPFVENNRPCARLIEQVFETKPLNEQDVLERFLNEAVIKRKMFFNGVANTRVVYGASDNLPGLIVDAYQEVIIIQINTAGIDRHREYLHNYFEKLGDFKVLFLDNKEYRKGEMLPEFEQEDLAGTLKILENNINYEIRPEVLQKIGFYFDHRLNRARAAKLLSYLNGKTSCLDLFSYVGAWGMNLLAHGASNVDFVDQGDFSYEIEQNLKINKFEGQGSFFRDNVFTFMKNLKGKKYDLICSDPPAFCKSKREAARAREGYVKLHSLCLDSLNLGGIFVACSCTHYVSHAEFQDSVVKAATKSKRSIQLIDVGMQSFDHPIKTLESKNSYLKYYAYYVE